MWCVSPSHRSPGSSYPRHAFIRCGLWYLHNRSYPGFRQLLRVSRLLEWAPVCNSLHLDHSIVEGSNFSDLSAFVLLICDHGHGKLQLGDVEGLECVLCILSFEHPLTKVS